MLANKKILAVIPARGGSKGLIHKNIHPCAGKPLIAWTIMAAQASDYIDHVILSSDDDQIIKIAEEYQCHVPFKRPAILAKDETPGVAPILHALEQLPSYDYVIVLQPTSPLRTTKNIDQCIEHCIQETAVACVSVCPVEQSPFWMYTRSTNGKLFPLLPGEQYQRRQDLPPIYRLNGAIYMADTNWLLKNKTFLAEETLGFEMTLANSVDIDTIEDLRNAEKQLSASENL